MPTNPKRAGAKDSARGKRVPRVSVPRKRKPNNVAILAFLKFVKMIDPNYAMVSVRTVALVASS